MRFLFSDVRNDAGLEAAWDEDQPEGEYRLSLTTYVEAVEALVKVAEAAHGYFGDEYGVSDPSARGRLRDALDSFDFGDVQ